MENSEKLLDNLDDAENDKELFDAASAIVAIPKKPAIDFSDSSFLLHAPLEICARYFLLPLVDDEHTTAARKQMRLTAKKYFESPDVENAEVHKFDIELVPYAEWATSLLFASHAPILLALQHTLGETNESIHNVLGRMGRDIFDAPEAQMAWSHKPPTHDEISPELLKHPGKWFFDHVGNIRHVDGGAEAIRASVERVEAAGVIEPLVEILGNIANFSERADFKVPFQSLMRMCALSMVKESDVSSKYGWSHCLTIPHSLWVLSSVSGNPGRLLQAATTQAATFRSLLGEEKLSENDLNEYFEPDEDSIFAEHYVRIIDIISLACTLEDAHLVKYVYSCFDCMKRDPQYSKLYIAAAGKLLSIWQG